eukprot:TRINITY_DN8005_c0_g1_i1.p1 TRINITY_DN8005_c0_g1~~TRINITY_DN8005_c0_g1_i1.p1  ORF type:complete len:194 (-),score=54.84 TRINITY_DN8005_c0_g1_i1:25-567(-)
MAALSRGALLALTALSLSDMVAAETDPERSLQSVVSNVPQPPSGTAAFQPPALPASSAALQQAQQAQQPQQPQVQQPQVQQPQALVQPPTQEPQASKAAVTTTPAKLDEDVQSWLSRLGAPSIAMIVIAIAAGPACVLSIYRRSQQEEVGEGFGGILGWSCRRNTWKADQGSSSESDGIN